MRAANRVNSATDQAEKRALAESLRAGAWLLGLLAQDPTAWFKRVQVTAEQLGLQTHPATPRDPGR